MAGVCAGLGSSVAAVVAFVSIRSLSGLEPAAVMTVWFDAVSVTVSVIPMLLSYPGPAAWPAPREWLILGAMVVASFVGQLSLARGFTLLAPSRAAAINLLQLVYAGVLGTVFLHERIQGVSIGGAVLMAAGVLAAMMGRDGGRRSLGQSAQLALDMEAARLGYSDDLQLLAPASPPASTSSDDSLFAADPVCIPVSQLDAAQKSSRGTECPVFVPVQDVGHARR